MPLIDYPALFLKADNARNAGQVDEAIRRYAEISHLAEDDGRLEELGRALHMAGVAATQKADSSNSSSLRDSLQYFEHAAIVFQQAQLTKNLGALYRDQAGSYALAQQDQRALDYFQKSIELLTTADEPGELGSTYAKIGKFYFSRNDFSAAEQYFQKALSCFKQDPTAGFYWASTLFEYAELHCRQQNFPEAELLLEESLGWFRADHDQERYDQRLAQLYGTLSLVTAAQNKQAKAKAYGRNFLDHLKILDPSVAKIVQSRLDNLFN